MRWGQRWSVVLGRARTLMPWHRSNVHPPEAPSARVVDAYMLEGMVFLRFSEEVEYTNETPTDEHIYGQSENRPGGPSSPMLYAMQIEADLIAFIFDYMPIEGVVIEAGQVNLLSARGLVPPQSVAVRQ